MPIRIAMIRAFTKFYTIRLRFSSVLDYQREILSLPWARIYTTNYDNMVSLVKGSSFPIFTFEEEKPRTLPQSFAVYLHGSIRKATDENAESQLILNSYHMILLPVITQIGFMNSNEIAVTFDACYFLGFSLGDHHISGLMAAGETSARPHLLHHTDPPSRQIVDRAPPYGEIVPIGFDGFANLVKTLPAPNQSGESAVAQTHLSS